MLQQPASTAPARPIASPAEAQDAIGRLGGVIDALTDMLDRETALVRAGRLSEVARLEPAKSELACQYVAATLRLKSTAPHLRDALPALLAPLRPRHDRLRALVQANLTVLATAHAVSESIIRGVADEVTRKSTPQTYGASGRQAAPALRQARPFTLSRTL